MKKKEKIWVLLLAIAVIIFIIVLLVNRSGKDENNNVSNSGADSSQINNGENSGEPKDEEFVARQEDGTRVNTSNKIKETKRIGGLEISGVTITENNNLTQLLGTVENTSRAVDGGYTLKIIVVDKENQELIDMLFDITELQPGQSTQIDCSATFDYSNAYDVRFEKM